MTGETDSLAPLPHGWVRATVGDIVTFEYGKGLTKHQRDADGEVVVYGSNGPVGHHSVALVQEPCLIVGRKGAVGQVHMSTAPCWPIDTTYYVVPPEGIDLTFLHYLLSDLRMGSLDRSTAIPGLNRNDAYALPIRLPPTAEQKRIVANIEELLTQLDAGVAALESARAQLQRYRQAVLKAAVEGDLTREWREAHKGELEPASVLLEGILEDRRASWEADQLEKMRAKRRVPKDDKWKKKYKKPATPDMTGLPELPEGWLWASLHAAAGEIYRYPTFYGMEHLEQGVPVIRGEHLNEDGTISHDWDNYWFVSEELSREFPRTIVEVGDLIMSVRGSVGKLGLIDEKLQGAQVSPNCIRISLFKRHCLPKVVLFYLMSFRGQTSIRKNVSATTIQTIKASLLSRTAIPIPPFVEQSVIVEEVERRLSVAAEMQKAVEQSLKRGGRLRQSILKRAFEGKLVAQDPTDEPASVLLERIKVGKATREAETKDKKKRRKKGTPHQLELL